MFVFFLVFLISTSTFFICFCQTSLFRLVIDNGYILNQEPIESTIKSENKIICFMQCQQNPNCCFVHIQNIQEPNQFECNLFELSDSVETEKRNQSQIFEILNEPNKCGIHKDCKEWFHLGFKNDGVYNIKINGRVTKVYCDMTSNGGGWTVFQRRFNGKVDFQRTWNEYKNGFGDVSGEYWLGNEFIHQLTDGKSNILIRIEATDFQGVHKYIIYKGFRVESEINKYKLHTGVFEDGTSALGPNWENHNEMFFSTKDRDNDMHASKHCAVYYGGGWWHKHCFHMNPNNHYSAIENVASGSGMSWHAWHNGHTKVMKTFQMSMKEI